MRKRRGTCSIKRWNCYSERKYEKRKSAAHSPVTFFIRESEPTIHPLHNGRHGWLVGEYMIICNNEVDPNEHHYCETAFFTQETLWHKQIHWSYDEVILIRQTTLFSIPMMCYDGKNGGSDVMTPILLPLNLSSPFPPPLLFSDRKCVLHLCLLFDFHAKLFPNWSSIRSITIVTSACAFIVVLHVLRSFSLIRRKNLFSLLFLPISFCFSPCVFVRE